MALRDDVMTVLTDDTTLMGLLTGGLHSATEISRQDTPTAFDANKELLPCGLLHFETDVKSGPYHTSSNAFFALMLYQRTGYDTIDSALARAFALLHEQRFGSNLWLVIWLDDVLDAKDDALGCAMALSRYMAVRRK